MRNFTQPIITEVGTVTVRGQDFIAQRITYGTQQHIHVFRKGELHRHGLVFTSEREYAHWKGVLGAQRELF